MSKKQKNAQDEMMEDAPEVQEAPARIAPVERRISFDQWAARENIPMHNRRGRRAFVKNPDTPRTLAEWNALFKTF